MTGSRVWGCSLALFALLAGCGRAVTEAGVAPPPPPRAPGGLPPVPEVRGELRIDVVYPPAGATVAVSGSTFIFGNVGRGDARLTINGTEVEVAPNGGWLAYLPVPPDGVYQLAATAGDASVTATHAVTVPAPPDPEPGFLRVVAGSIQPSGVITGVRGERIDVRFLGSEGSTASLHLPDGRVVPLVEREAVIREAGFMLDEARTVPGLSEYVGSFELEGPILSGSAIGELPTLVSEEEFLRETSSGVDAVVELARGLEVVQNSVDIALGALEPGLPRVGVAATMRPDSTVIGRRGTGADQAWDFFWPNGTLLAIDGERDGFYRVRLTAESSAWVARDDVILLGGGYPRPAGWVGPSIQLTPSTDRVAIRFSMPQRLPFRVIPDEQGISVEFYGATGRPAYVGYGGADPFVHLVTWDQPTDEVFRFDVELTAPLWGYRYRWEESALVLEVRRPPAIDPSRPLAGLRVAVDAGHLGSGSDTGASGPTRLLESQATLAVARELATLLRDEGAEVVPIRMDTTIVPLIDRPILATDADADIFLSIHFNAFPDGVDPFANYGTSMFYYWPHSIGLARRLQQEVLAAAGLPDRGVRFQNLAITRTTWMPAVLTESLFLMFPEQEAALRNPDFVRRLARAHLDGIRSFVLDTAAAMASSNGP